MLIRESCLGGCYQIGCYQGLLSSPVPTPLFGVRLGLGTQHLYEAAGDRWAKNG